MKPGTGFERKKKLMSIKKQKVMVAMSGGVDSSVSAALLLREGYDCAGVYMITCDAGAQGSEKARRVAEKEGIEFFVLDMRKSFDVVFEYLIS